MWSCSDKCFPSQSGISSGTWLRPCWEQLLGRQGRGGSADWCLGYLHLSAHRGATRWLPGEAEVPSHLPLLPSPFIARVCCPPQLLADVETGAAPTKGA